MLVGAESDLSYPNPVVSVLTEARKHEIETLLSKGVPIDLIPHCWLVDSTAHSSSVWLNKASTAYLGVGGTFPKRTPDELTRAARQGIGLSLQLQPGFDLRVIADALKITTRLSIGSEGLLAGWSALSQAHAVAFLLLSVECHEDARLESLENLGSFDGVGPSAARAARNPSLERLVLDLRHKPWPEDLVVEGSIEYLHLMAAKYTTRLPTLVKPEALRTLRIGGAREFDLASLAGLVNLQWLEISKCPNVRNVEVLKNLPMLRHIDLA